MGRASILTVLIAIALAISALRGMRRRPALLRALLDEFVWLGGRDSNPDRMVQSHVSYRWTTSQCGRRSVANASRRRQILDLLPHWPRT
jgi:hypothetical protein